VTLTWLIFARRFRLGRRDEARAEFTRAAG
jgi:hypothetical protein